VFVVGVDACRTGWIAVATGDGDPEAHYLPTIDALGPLATGAHSVAIDIPTIDALGPLATGAHSVAIDIPIGLPTSGTREADLLARRFLGARRSSVFLTPVREAIEAETYAVATATALARTGTGISQQAYALGKKILEVERWLASSPCLVFEVHPEVSFAVLLGAPAKASKKTWAGMVERWQALQAAGISLDRINGIAGVRASVDDMLDAAVAAWTAGRIARGAARSFPDSPQYDSSDRPVAIWA
jgi:predicted RNase H-like nuclease